MLNATGTVRANANIKGVKSQVHGQGAEAASGRSEGRSWAPGAPRRRQGARSAPTRLAEPARTRAGGARWAARGPGPGRPRCSGDGTAGAGLAHLSADPQAGSRRGGGGLRRAQLALALSRLLHCGIRGIGAAPQNGRWMDVSRQTDTCAGTRGCAGRASRGWVQGAGPDSAAESQRFVSSLWLLVSVRPLSLPLTSPPLTPGRDPGRGVFNIPGSCHLQPD